MRPHPEINLKRSRVNDVVDALLARYETAVDISATPRKVYQSVERGLAIPGQTIVEADCPFIRIWENKSTARVKSIQFVDDTWYPMLNIFTGFYAAPDLQGRFPDAQAFRNDLTKFTLSVINTPSAGTPNGITPDNTFWGFPNAPEGPNNRQIPIDFTTPLQGIGLDIPILPPWYIVRLDLVIDVFNIDQL